MDLYLTFYIVRYSQNEYIFNNFLKFESKELKKNNMVFIDNGFSFSGCEKCPTRKCVELYGASACGNQSLKDIASIERSMRLFFLRLIKMSKDGKEKNFADVKVCPDGYGFQWKRNRDERFDLGWN